MKFFRTDLDPLLWFGVLQHHGELRFVHQNLHFGTGGVLTRANTDGHHPHGEILPWRRGKMRIREKKLGGKYWERVAQTGPSCRFGIENEIGNEGPNLKRQFLEVKVWGKMPVLDLKIWGKMSGLQLKISGKISGLELKIWRKMRVSKLKPKNLQIILQGKHFNLDKHGRWVESVAAPTWGIFISLILAPPQTSCLPAPQRSLALKLTFLREFWAKEWCSPCQNVETTSGSGPVLDFLSFSHLDPGRAQAQGCFSSQNCCFRMKSNKNQQYPFKTEIFCGSVATTLLLPALLLPVYGPLAQNFFWTNFNTLSSSCWGKNIFKRKKKRKKKRKGDD